MTVSAKGLTPSHAPVAPHHTDDLTPTWRRHHERIELTLSEREKAGASKTFFTKVKEQLLLMPAQLKVLEY